MFSESCVDELSPALNGEEDCWLANTPHSHKQSSIVGDTEDYQPVDVDGSVDQDEVGLLPLLSTAVLMLGRLLEPAACKDGSVIDPLL